MINTPFITEEKDIETQEVQPQHLSEEDLQSLRNDGQLILRLTSGSLYRFSRCIISFFQIFTILNLAIVVYACSLSNAELNKWILVDVWALFAFLFLICIFENVREFMVSKKLQECMEKYKLNSTEEVYACIQHA